MEYEKLYTDAIGKLWHYVVYSDKSEIITAALQALRHFDFNELPLIHMPDIFRQKIILPKEYTKTPIDATRDPAEVLPYIPGECWVQVIQYVNHSAIDAASELVSYLIDKEIKNFRKGVYILPENHPEPANLSRLNQQSILRAIVKYLLSQVNKSVDENEVIVVACLRSISVKFSRSIPPLDWFFLLDFMNRSIEMKRLCLLIAANKLLESGSAKNVIENYLTSFDANTCIDEVEIENALELLPHICVGTEANTFNRFVTHIFDYAFTNSKRNDFEKGGCTIFFSFKC